MPDRLGSRARQRPDHAARSVCFCSDEEARRGRRPRARALSAQELDAASAVGVSMADPIIRFDDGAGYEKFMGTWSRMVGDVFIDWLAPAKGLKWVDVGCGNGDFTE